MLLLKLSNPQCDLINAKNYDAFSQEVRKIFSGSHEYTGINLGGLNIDENNAAAIINCLKGIDGLKELSFALTGLNDKSLTIALTNLEEQTNLTTLDFRRCTFTPEAYAQLFDFLIRHPHITSLSLRVQKITDSTFMSFKDKIQHTKLSLLDVSHNNLTDVGMLALAHIAKNSALTELKIGHNFTTYQETKQFAETLRGTKVTHVELVAYPGQDFPDPENEALIASVCDANRKQIYQADPVDTETVCLLLSNPLQRLNLNDSQRAVKETPAPPSPTRATL